MSTLEFAILVPFAIFAIFLIVRQSIHSNRKYPFSERTARSILCLSAWLRCVGVAHDAAILRYRVARRTPIMRLDSTDEREHQEYVRREQGVEEGKQ